MLLCNYLFVTAASTSSCSSLPHLHHRISRLAPTSTSIACILVSVLLLVIVIVIHLVPVTATIASCRCAGGVAAAPVAALAEGTKEADFPGVNLCLRRRTLLGLLHLDDADGVALAVPSFVVVNNDIVNLVIPLDD